MTVFNSRGILVFGGLGGATIFVGVYVSTHFGEELFLQVCGFLLSCLGGMLIAVCSMDEDAKEASA